MEKVLVIGLGETGKPIFDHIKDSGYFKVYGYDVKKSITLPPSSIQYLHICIPYSDDFCKVVIDYIRKYKPKLIVIHSTVPPLTTQTIFQTLSLDDFYCIIHSPIRGVHATMYEDLARYTKYIGPTSPRAAIEAKEHLEKIGFRTKVMGSAEETELGKLFETSVYGAEIAIWQEMERIARAMEIDFVNAIDFVRDTDEVRGDRPIFYPDIIGGHCVIPNFELLMKAADECRPKPAMVVFLNAWRSNFLAKTSPAPKETTEKMKEIFKRSRKCRK
jgi:UDP-N-acetyl-D-mannosaminuronate dehydrogenase